MQASGRTARSSVSTKIMLAAALIAVIAFAITATITFLESRGALLPLSQRVMERTAQVGAAEIKAKLEVAMDTVTSSSRTMASLVEAGVTDREVGRAILKREMEANPDWLMIWMIWEPEAFDGKDAEWQGAPGHTSDGRYYVSFQRINGQVSMEVAPLLNYNDPGDGDYYLVPKELKRPVVIEPYLYPVDGKDVLMTSITAPIMRDGQVLGIFGVDLALEGVRTMVDGIQAMDVGYARLLSPAGAVLGDRDASLVGKPLPGADVADLLARLGKGELAQRREANAVFNEIALEAYAPFKVGAAEETFALGVVVPEAYILRDARRLLWTVAGTGLIGAVLLCAVLFFALRRLVLNPLNAVVATSNDIAEGRLDRRIAQDRDDELGVLAGAMSRVQTQVKDFIAAQLQLAQEHDAGRMSQRIDASRYPGAFGEMAAAVNHLVDEQIKVNAQVMELLGRYAIGDLSQDMPALPGEKASITETMARAKSNLLAINADIQRLVAAAAHGDFSARGESARYQFAFREMVEGLNTLMREADAGLGDVGRVLSALAEGDLTARVERNYDGAFGVLASSANRTTQQIAQIARQIQQATDQINTAAAEIAAGNNDLAARTETQAASLEETASSMEELTSTVRQNTDSSVQALELANGAAKVAERGGTVVRNVVSTMDDISTSSKKIGDIISVIDGIAFQTNILALNAAVEAARAGEQGRGFAVVASEVRALAQRSADAAKEIKELIVASVRNVDTGAQLVADAGATMDEIVQAVARVSDIMGDITAASKEQAAGIEQVNQTITQMDQMTQQNAALVEQATAAARAMEQQADSLARSAAVFRL